MAKRIMIDPITRIEGHLRIEVEIAGGKVVNAWSSGQMFRGIEIILKGAFNRAKEANSYLKHKFNDNSEIFGVGIEAGLVRISMANSNYMDFQFCVIIDKDDKLSLGSGTAFEYPQYGLRIAHNFFHPEL